MPEYLPSIEKVGMAFPRIPPIIHPAKYASVVVAVYCRNAMEQPTPGTQVS